MVKTYLLEKIDESSISPECWGDLLGTGETDTVFLTWHWQYTWWNTFKRGRLLFIAVECEGRKVALAPLFTESGMIYFVGSGGSDYLDFIGNTSNPEVMDAILERAKDCVPEFLGFRFYHVPDNSQTGVRLQAAANRLGLVCFDEGDLVAPMLDFSASSKIGFEVTRKKSLLRHEKFFRNEGGLDIRHFTNGEEILSHLNEFFKQHILRWSQTSCPSLFNNTAQQAFYQKLTETAVNIDWLHFTRIDWEGRPIAFHFGFFYRKCFFWYKPSFAIDLARRSPGEVLIRQLLLTAISKDADRFDFGIGDEAFKHRFANQICRVRTWGIYPSKKIFAVHVKENIIYEPCFSFKPTS